MPKPEGLVYKDIVGEIEKGAGEDGTLICKISTDAVDRMGEVLDPTGVDLKHYKQNPVVLWAHDYSTPPIAKAQWVKRDGNVILSKLKFAPTPFAQEIKVLYELGFMSTFSVGFIPKKWVDGDGAKNPARKYTEWELLEYSAVPVPANPEALALAHSKGLINTPELKALIQEPLMQEFNNEEKEIVKEVAKEVNPLDEVMAENKNLQAQIDALEKENGELRLKLYAVLLIKKQDSEITADSVVKTFEDVTGRVIRKLQGKID
jgi:HK97 family phage prohead protease